jgi:hypothetical protein
VFAQLRYMLAAEYSSIVPQEDQHGRLALPKRTQPNLASIAVRQDDAGERSAERTSH